MSNADELKKSVQNENDQIDEDLKKASKIANLIPFMEERKKEASAKKTFVDNMPDDVLEEIAPNILPFQKDDEQKFCHTPLAGITFASLQNVSPYSASSGTTSAYEYIAGTIRDSRDQPYEWMQP